MPKPLKKISATLPGLMWPYKRSKAFLIPSPVRLSPTSTVKPSRLSSLATSRASLIGSFRGASASGYFALPMTRANRSAAMPVEGKTGAIDRIKSANNEWRILIRRQSSQKGADPSLAPRRPYPTKNALSNRARRSCQQATEAMTTATIDRVGRQKRPPMSGRAVAGVIDTTHPRMPGISDRAGVTAWAFDLFSRWWLGSARLTQPDGRSSHGKRLRNLCAPLCDDVAAHSPYELPFAGPAREGGLGPRLLRLADSGRRPRHPGGYRLQRGRGRSSRPQAHAQPGRCIGTLRRQGRDNQGRRRDAHALRPRRQPRPVSECAISPSGPRDELCHRALHVLWDLASSVFGRTRHADGAPRLPRACHLSLRRWCDCAWRHRASRRRPFRWFAGGTGRDGARARSACVGCGAFLRQSASPQPVSDRL